MRGYVATGLRWGLVLLAVMLLVCMLASYSYAIITEIPIGSTATRIFASFGGLTFDVRTRYTDPPGPYLVFSPQTPGLSKGIPYRPHWFRERARLYLYVPLWQVGLLCLAWPVTSLLIRLRKARRGFPIRIRAQEDVSCCPASDPLGQ